MYLSSRQFRSRFDVEKALRNMRIFQRLSKKCQNFELKHQFDAESMSIFQHFLQDVEKALKNQLCAPGKLLRCTRLCMRQLFLWKKCQNSLKSWKCSCTQVKLQELANQINEDSDWQGKSHSQAQQCVLVCWDISGWSSTSFMGVSATVFSKVLFFFFFFKSWWLLLYGKYLDYIIMTFSCFIFCYFYVTKLIIKPGVVYCKKYIQHWRYGQPLPSV